jgi:hypothetical protein
MAREGVLFWKSSCVVIRNSFTAVKVLNQSGRAAKLAANRRRIIHILLATGPGMRMGIAS